MNKLKKALIFIVITVMGICISVFAYEETVSDVGKIQRLHPFLNMKSTALNAMMVLT